MSHSWILQKLDLDLAVMDIYKPRSDVWVCDRCGQMTISELGKEPDDASMTATSVADCDSYIVRCVMDR